MNTLNDLSTAIEKEDLFSVLDYAEDRKDTLWQAWSHHDDFECALRLAIQETESIKNQNPNFNCNIPYQLGKLDGYIELFEKLFRAEESMRTVRQNLLKQTPKTRQILQCLYQSGGMRHGELADTVGSSYSSLTNIMKKILLSGAVESTRSGKNTYYYLTEVGRQYCEQQGQHRDELQSLIKTVIEDSIHNAFINGISRTANKVGSQRLNVSDQFIPIFNNEAYDPLEIVGITTIGDIKFVEISGTMTNVEDEKNSIAFSSVDILTTRLGVK